MHSDLLFTDSGLEEGSEAQPRSAVGCSVLFYELDTLEGFQLDGRLSFGKDFRFMELCSKVVLSQVIYIWTATSRISNNTGNLKPA